jgi:flagellar biosynthesis protein FliP
MNLPRTSVFLLCLSAILITPWMSTAALAQQASGNLLSNSPVTGRAIELASVMTLLSLAPSLVVMMSSFTRFVIAFSFLRSSMGLQSTPANLVLISLSMFMTLYVMAPTFDQAWVTGIRPLMNAEITEMDAYTKISTPFRSFMLKQVRPKDLQLFEDLSRTGTTPLPKQGEEPQVDMRILVPAFMISELRRGFEIGFLIALPFLVIDMIVATVTMSMGMMMLPPSVISLPIKVLFFVLVDGWNMLVGSLIRSVY